jgi:peptidoglycan hydrolase-like protein with peptidoglycan-binding domain
MQTMNLRLLSAALLAPATALAVNSITSLHPEAAYPDDAPPLSSPGPYAELIRQAQEKLHQFGFDAGPVNGAFGSKTQAALAQFQLSRDIPASGMLDEPTRAELGVVD